MKRTHGDDAKLALAAGRAAWSCSWPIPAGPSSPGATRATGRSPRASPTGADDLLVVARREIEEETGHRAPAGADALPLELGTIVQKGGKVVHAWAIEGDLDPATAVSNEFEMEWPPRSGRRQRFPEIDRVAWFEPTEARRPLRPTQVPFVDRLVATLGASDEAGDT